MATGAVPERLSQTNAVQFLDIPTPPRAWPRVTRDPRAPPPAPVWTM
ncbi:hypothetical protein NSPZN2_10653 [Nitrospira defluvii]|uniref:Uncharacterized protein n=1 Tax=Nitrospira defluvii TaxID=330214 RepID=A0ABM8QJL8_9BACT|nr:hypothetical protein NSPZN2_10653 [Nitrospira defluvii]